MGKYENNALWSILIETVYALPMFKPHLNYVKNVLLKEKPGATPEDIRDALGIPFGEALVIVHELEKQEETHDSRGDSETTR